MPRHTFVFPNEIKRRVAQHVRSAIVHTDIQRFSQEPAYVAALLAKLDGFQYEDEHGHVRFTATVFDAIAPNSSERLFGADCAITAQIRGPGVEIVKVIPFQAKKGEIARMGTRESKRLRQQLRMMKEIMRIRSPKILEIVEHGGNAVPRVVSGNKYLSGGSYLQMSLADYFVARVLTTLDGDTRPRIVEAFQDSRLSQLRVEAAVNDERRVRIPGQRGR